MPSAVACRASSLDVGIDLDLGGRLATDGRSRFSTGWARTRASPSAVEERKRQAEARAHFQSHPRRGAAAVVFVAGVMASVPPTPGRTVLWPRRWAGFGDLGCDVEPESRRQVPVRPDRLPGGARRAVVADARDPRRLSPTSAGTNRRPCAPSCAAAVTFLICRASREAARLFALALHNLFKPSSPTASCFQATCRPVELPSACALSPTCRAMPRAGSAWRSRTDADDAVIGV